ncbi:transcript variant X3 [Nothobranchius furzeri]|uniref:Transcript variant X3 n=1 Tax=Nothobranchius furzeri TaxID=105023 RepID=A0A1A8B928_NOTFU|nr:transcript variant X3 [Nothobranchius furzeri]
MMFIEFLIFFPRARERGFKFYISQYLYSFEASDNDQGTGEVVVRAECFRSMKKTEKAHKLSVVLKDSQPVQLLDFTCTCKAGEALCNHCVALPQSAHYSQLNVQVVPPVLSCTEGEQQWHKPRVMGIKPGPVEKMVVLSAKPKTRKTTEGVRSKLYKGLHGDLPDGSAGF